MISFFIHLYFMYILILILHALWEKFLCVATSILCFILSSLISHKRKREKDINIFVFLCYDDIVSLSGLTVHLAFNIFITISWHFREFYDFIIRQIRWEVKQKDEKKPQIAEDCAYTLCGCHQMAKLTKLVWFAWSKL